MNFNQLVMMAWDELIHKDDRTSPEEYPDHCLITRDELEDFMKRSASAGTQPTPVGGRGHLKPVILDSKGNAVAPPPISQQLAVERRQQYDIDRLEALLAIPNLAAWRLFSLRWGLAPPPGGWEDHMMQLRVIHAVRLGVKEVPLFQKTISASWLHAHGIALPPGVKLINGSLTGVELPD